MECFTKVMHFGDFMDLSTPDIRSKFLFNTAIVSARTRSPSAFSKKIDIVINWCEGHCVNKVIIDTDEESSKIKLFFEDESDLIMFKLGFNE